MGFYTSCFERVAEAIRSRGGSFRWETDGKITLQNIKDAEDAIGLVFPDDYREFLTEMGDGLIVRLDHEEWYSPIEFDPLNLVVADYPHELRLIEEKLELQEKYKNPDESNEEILNYAEMLKGSIPIMPEGSGDQLMLDTRKNPAPVFYREWYWEYLYYEIDSSFREFIEHWSQFAFAAPNEMFFYPADFPERHEWKAEGFPEAFRNLGIEA